MVQQKILDIEMKQAATLNSIAVSKTDSSIQHFQKHTQTKMTTTAQQVVIFDGQVEDLSVLLSGLLPGVTTHVLSPEQNGIDQITEILAQRPTASLTLVAHGFPGGLKLGTEYLELSTLDNYASQLRSWFDPSVVGQFNLLACNVAVGDAGAEFVEKLQAVSNAKVTASSRLVGNGYWPSVATEVFTPHTLQAYRFTLAWEVVGTPQFSAQVIETADLEVSGETPYVVYKNRNDTQLTISKFENNVWTSVGVPNVAAGGFALSTDVEFVNGTPYVAYLDANDGDTTKVIRFDGTNWVPVGNAVSSNGASSIDLETGSDGKLYVLYRDAAHGGRATLRVLDNNTWVPVGPEGFSLGPILQESGISQSDLKIGNDGTPYVVYNYTSGGVGNVVVQSFNTTTGWTTVGNTSFETGTVRFPNLAIQNGVPYVAYSDPNDGKKAYVQTFVNGNWTLVGSPVSTASAFSPDLEFDSAGIPYLVYPEAAAADRATVKKFVNGAWVDAGDFAFSTSAAPYTDVAISSSGIPYVLYRDETDGGGKSKITVERLPDNVVPDTIAPNLVSITRQTPSTETTDADTLVFQVAFSEDVQGVDAGDFALTDDDINVNLNVTAVNASLYNISVSGEDLEDFNGVIGLELAASPTITDLGTAPNSLSTVAPVTVQTYTLSNSDDDDDDGDDDDDDDGGGDGNGNGGTDDSLLTPFSGIDVVGLTRLGSSNTVQFQLTQGEITDVSEIVIFRTDAFGENDTELTRFSILQTDELPSSYSPVFTIDSSLISEGEFLQFAFIENGVTQFASLTTITNSEVSLTFDNGVQLTTSVVNESSTTNLLVNDAQSIDLTGLMGSLDVTFNVFREAADDNTVGFYVTETADGGVRDPLTNAILLPGDAGYKEAAIANRLDIELTGQNGQVSTFEASMTAGLQLGIFVIIDGADATTNDVVFSYGQANGGADHIRQLGDNTFGIEDQPALGDMDFDDLVVEFSIR
ncbi:DUF4347 domain-containing protein [Leptothoe sp. PORK10 BA2]|uniref:DUF4347 domain-containing protein n=1 Tax=Leptothoe sp. PORK10 BA2 TaxID=3110254 RepID=UPI002B2055F5|nr:DUF4347 domain-containing protein [Leptothoe sp. PORK10 BA2]MEA5466977.1 DUF4347 domain-containing protein [Leptothoe sp. PORK10 BA2]